MRTGARNIKSGSQYEVFFPKSKGDFVEIKAFAKLDDTIELMQQVISSTLDDTKQIAKQLKALNTYQTCKNVWEFSFSHLQYKKDEVGKEQVRRPSRAWHDRKTGVDCDCMTVFIASILTNLGIPFIIRLTNYHKNNSSQETDEFEHVYPVALIENKKVIMDCVVHAFDYQVPYKNKQDISMKLQYLNGIDGDGFAGDINQNIWGELFGMDYSPNDLGIFMDEMELEGLDGRKERIAKRKERKAQPLKDRIKNGIHVVNRLNPATAILRAGVLASMKLNIMNVAGKIRFAYLSPQKAQANRMNMLKHQQLNAIRQKLEKIFHGAGGKIENLKQAILTGKGNRDRKVSLNGLEGIDSNVNDWQTMEQILGLEMIQDEFSDNSINGLGELGSVTLATAIASASGVIATLSSLIKKLGDLFPQGTPQNVTEIEQEKTAKYEESTRLYSKDGIEKLIKQENLPTVVPTTENLPVKMANEVLTLPENDLDTTTTPEKTVVDDPEKDEKKGIVAWVKENPMLSAGIGLLTVGAIYLVVKASKKKNSVNGLSGVKTKKTSKKGKVKTPTSSKYIRKVELL